MDGRPLVLHPVDTAAQLNEVLTSLGANITEYLKCNLPQALSCLFKTHGDICSSCRLTVLCVLFQAIELHNGKSVLRSEMLLQINTSYQIDLYFWYLGF